MAFDGKSLDDYVDVAERIAEFRDKHPEGSIQPVDPTTPYKIERIEGTSKDGKPFTATMIVYTAAAYRTPDDKRPGVGCAWEPFPGRTSFTLNSELMNAETSAQGRAIVAALAADSKRGVASKQEVRNRAAERDPVPAEQDHWTDQPAGQLNGEPYEPENRTNADGKQRSKIFAKFKILGIADADRQRALLSDILHREVSSRKGLSYADAEAVLKDLQARVEAKEAAEAAAAEQDAAAEAP